jgi:hypothetical protein
MMHHARQCAQVRIFDIATEQRLRVEVQVRDDAPKLWSYYVDIDNEQVTKVSIFAAMRLCLDMIERRQAVGIPSTPLQVPNRIEVL